MKITGFFIFFILNVFIQAAYAGHGGDIKVKNDTPFIITQSNSTRNDGVNEFSVPQVIPPDVTNNIYFEARFFLAGTNANASVSYQVTCPDNQKDEFVIRISMIPGKRLEFANVRVYYVNENQRHCVNIDDDQGLVWTWNKLNIPSPIVVIHQQ